MLQHRNGYTQTIFTMNDKGKTKVFNLVILDKSGSMGSICKEAIDGYNETLASIRATQTKYADTQEHFVSLAAFCNCGIDMIYDMTPIEKAETLTDEKYRPCCLTPLFDAIGISVNSLKKKIADVEDAAVLVTIITDGFENASKEWNSKAVQELVKECKDQGWMFSFIGAGEDVLKVANDLDIKNKRLWVNTSEGTKTLFREENEARMEFCCKLECYDSHMAPEDKKEFLKRISKEYYDKLK